MSVIQKIRDKYAAVVIAVIALSLVGFILMDAFVGRGKGGTPGGDVGKVNGQKIEKNDFEKKISLQQAMYGAQAPQREQLISSAWEQTVDEIVMEQEYDKVGLQFTAKELNDVLFGANPPQWLSQQFTDPKTGMYDVNQAKQYFAQMKKQKNNPNLEMFNEAYITPTISQTLRTKYMALLGESAYIPKWMAERTIADQNVVARFSYVSVPYSSISDSSIKVTDDDVRNYMNKHKDAFVQDDASRSVSYVAFNASASGADSAKVLSQLNSLRGEFAAATDPESYLARVGSENPYFNGYVLGSKLQVPNADTIKKLPNGQVYGPYVDGTHYTLAKMIDSRSVPDSAKVRHILIKTGEKGQVTLPDSIAKARIDSVANAAKSGADFNALVLQYSDDEGSKNTKGEYTFTSQQFPNLSKEFAETAFYGTTGDKKVVKVENQAYSGYHYIEVLEQKQMETGYKIAYLAKPIEASQETINSASNLASQFAANSRDKKQFEANAAKQNLTVLSASEIKQNDYQVAALGESRQFVRWVYENKAGDVSEPQEIGDKYVVAVITGVSEKGLMSVAKARITAEPIILNEKKAQQIISAKFKGGSTIEQVAQGAGVSVLRADSVSFAQPFIPNIGNEPKVAGAAFNKSLQNKVSEPIAGNTGVFVIRGESITALPNTNMDIEGLRKQMEMQQKQMSGYQSIEALKKAADVKDNRFDFY
ncbi:peptidylprolyl isomerase [Segetibacter sp.]|jgi:peptidyl-prolyl cis-trans isomerase D|uniref:peptidylprolyl isomerase n=1 Tax=Segetibacter sp. TaxID=2231182 RepID=UPI00262194F9|nr:peptidylprolyl isomerase [Segetibacter sp.]MCW3081119.1 peptidyl-prolyl cis-trans isomerase [Segetibacter sp.]